MGFLEGKQKYQKKLKKSDLWRLPRDKVHWLTPCNHPLKKRMAAKNIVFLNFSGYTLYSSQIQPIYTRVWKQDSYSRKWISKKKLTNPYILILSTFDIPCSLKNRLILAETQITIRMNKISPYINKKIWPWRKAPAKNSATDLRAESRLALCAMTQGLEH